jgi:G3E family GTPase
MLLFMITTKIPVTIITGFLGAGKTCLLNQIIGAYPEKKFAVIENEFGETGIDGGLIATAPEAIFELSNGCICCSLGDDFLFTLENLLGSNYGFDHLLVETTGIADPLSIVDAFISGRGIQERFNIDSIITVIDALNFDDLFNKQIEIRKQLATADQVLLNKIDLVDEPKRIHLNQLIRELNPTARVFETSFSVIEGIQLLDVGFFSGESLKASTLSFFTMAKSEKLVSETRLAVQSPGKFLVNHDIVSHGFSFDRSFDVNKFGLWMQNFLYYNQDRVFRVKGIVSFDQAEDQFVFHGVRGSFMFEVGKEWGSEPRYSKLVFIGKNLAELNLEPNLRQLLI